jgi:hypothetical protein
MHTCNTFVNKINTNILNARAKKFLENFRKNDFCSNEFSIDVVILVYLRPFNTKGQTFDTLINEETLLLAKFLRDENKQWDPRLPNLKEFLVIFYWAPLDISLKSCRL